MPAIPKKDQLTLEFLNELKRKDLLNLCKEHGIKGSGKNSELIEKLLESLKNVNDNITINVAEELNIQPPMTPQKKLDHCLPIVNTPGSISVIKSIVQSARKTGLHSSPVRVPFALSPMAARLNEAAKPVLFSPMKSKEPSQPIKEAFLTNDQEEENGEREGNAIMDSSTIGTLEDDEDYISKLKDEDDEDKMNEEPQINSKRPLEEASDEDDFDSIEHADFKKQKLPVDFDISVSSNLSSSASASVDSFPSLPPTNFSTDLLKNSKDPEFTSPELISSIDARKSRNEIHDGKSRSFDEAPAVLLLSKSSSAGSSKSQNSLLPSGIVKLLERKRLEKEQQQQQQKQQLDGDLNHNQSFSTSANQKKKFDLKESLKRPLPYKPHIGSVKPPKKD